MPELPEVETIVRYLNNHIRGKRILDFIPIGKNNRLFRDHKHPDEIKRRVIDKKIERIDRVGKNILIKLSDGTCLALHLMMTGKIFINPEEKTRVHDRMKLEFSGNTHLVFNDIRKFGRCRIIETPGKLFRRDALSISFAEFAHGLQDRKLPIKSALLNQNIVAGIGNIYADEILWYAKIDPQRSAGALKKDEARRIFRMVHYVLSAAVRAGGTSSRNYQRPDGSEGAYYKIRKAYQRTGQPCFRCGTAIKRIIIGQRSTHFCPKCQLLQKTKDGKKTLVLDI